MTGTHSRRQSSRRQASSTTVPTRKGTTTPEQQAAATRQTQAPTSAGPVRRSSRARAARAPATLPMNPTWKGHSRSCQAGPSSMNTAATAPATAGWSRRRTRTNRNHPLATIRATRANW